MGHNPPAVYCDDVYYLNGGNGSFSTTSTFHPCSARSAAAAEPAGPAPITSASVVFLVVCLCVMRLSVGRILGF